MSYSASVVIVLSVKLAAFQQKRFALKGLVCPRMQTCFAGLHGEILAQLISQLQLKCFTRGDGEHKSADFFGAQRELVFYVGKSLGGKSVRFVGAMVAHSPMTNLYKKLLRLPA